MIKEPRIPVGTGPEIATRARRVGLRGVARRFNISFVTVRALVQLVHQGGVVAVVRMAIPMCWKRAGGSILRVIHAALTPGLTLTEYAAGKQLDPYVLRGWGLSDARYLGKPAVRMPHYNEAGDEAATVFRRRLSKCTYGDDRFWPNTSAALWPRSPAPLLYGLNRLDSARARGYIVLVEGESDCHTLWSHNVPAIGVSGSGNWTESRDAPPLEGIPTVYAVMEPDNGGSKLRASLSASALRQCIKLVSLAPFKDVSALHCDDPERFGERWTSALAAAVPLLDVLDAEVGADIESAWEPLKTRRPARDHRLAVSTGSKAAR
jgi:hypothetical protein